MLKSYTPQPYDVYSIKKTLYPKIYKKVYTDLRDSGYLVESKEKLVEKWNSGFKDELKTVLDKIKETYPNETLVHAIQKENEKEENSLLEILTPKIQAPDKVTKICLDLIYQDSLLSNSKFTRYNIVTYQYCLLLLGSHKYYVESRQEERSKHNVLINRGRYTNPDDTHMYMLYGFILYRLGEFELKHSNNKNSAKEYYEKALSAYKCAKIANPTNNIADINLKILLNYVNRPPLSMNIS